MSNQDFTFLTAPVMLKARVELIDSARTDSLYYALLFISAWSVLTADLFVPRAKATGHKKDANVPHCVLRQIALTWLVFKGYG